ncbi:NAD(P)-dependent dehydrogenase (short-subunit alcohol dehydrogenase family) [Friedmanniella endophytica]|uniref:NAD(P)-dependent dehydrogenase (Short-subunit alcohol dehydrogenase family) n=1 Tax=Microlunatus kandeliicorticis TaxID=1759536 RepID=A0A7W3P7B4_9ACTN|nr:SDR family oxidoreductase [Microlunatus kandeliicorticis]MBA8795792.1 NAD(P)-dependent dehydrogenase (short-subunit alcohol dehydrogenase family) [Microlunatus kandeliicorticis]
MDLQLTGRVVLVVGGNGLIGSAVVTRLEEEGATVVVGSRSATRGLRLDATDDASVTSAVSAVLAEHGRLDGLVVTAAPAAQTLDPARQADPAQVIEAVDAKAVAFLRVANAVLPTMVEAGYGRIVGVSGQNAFLTGNVTGSVRNAALIIAAKNLADAVAGSGVTVNTVSPGAVSPTPAREVQQGAPGQSSPDQIADLITFLLSPRTAAVSGESIATGHRVRGVVSL